MKDVTAEQGTLNPFISLNTATVPLFSFALSLSLTPSFVKYQETILTDCINQISSSSTGFSFFTWHECMQNVVSLTDVTALD